MSERVLITGGAGFIGSTLADRLLEEGFEVRVLDALVAQVHPRREWPDYLSGAVERIRGDVRDAATVARALEGVDIVSHQAARVGVGQSQYQIEDYVDVNVRGTATLLEALLAAKHRVRKLVVAGSMSSYGEGLYACARCGPARPPLRSEAELARRAWEPRCPGCGGPLERRPIDEDQACRTNSVYALTKKAQEDLVLLFGGTYGIPAVALRYFNVYGPRQSLANPYTGVAAIFLARLHAGHRPVVYEDGEQTRDFVSVHDIVEANLRAIQRSTADGRAVNVGTGVGRSIAGIARTLAELLGRGDLAPEMTGTFRKGDVRHCYADVERLRDHLGLTAAWSFEDGMRELIAWSRGAEVDDRFEQAARELRERGLA